MEVIHTNAGFAGTSDILGKVDFFPNGGRKMPECNSIGCSHGKSYEYYAETISKPIYVGVKCNSIDDAFEGTCSEPEQLIMGGSKPKERQVHMFILTPFNKF